MKVNLDIAKNNIVPDSIINLSNSKGESFWFRIKSKSGSVEGKLYFPQKGSQKLIIFEPGFPGDASTRLEKLWLADLLKSNYTVFAIRHNGTIINGKYSTTYLNCPERQEKAEKEGQILLGDKDNYTIADWLIEPLIALEVFAPKYDEIHLVGHSFAGLAIFYSLIEFSKKLPHLAKRVARLISLAGSTGRIKEENDPILKQWSEHLRKDWIQERISIGDPDHNLKILKAAYIKIHQEVKFIPESIEVICVMVWGDTKDSRDELVPLYEAEDILKTLGKGYLILDKLEKSDKASDKLAHDMDNLPTQKFLDLVNIAWKPRERISTLEAD